MACCSHSSRRRCTAASVVHRPPYRPDFELPRSGDSGKIGQLRWRRAAQEALAYSSSSARDDALLATPETLMPSARVRVLQLDSATRSVLASAGVTGAQPRAYIQAAPYRADCRTVRWTDTASWTHAGDTGYVVARLAARDYWIDGAPVFVIAEAWSYPYPRSPQLRGYPPAKPPFASPEALFSFEDRVTRSRNGLLREDAPADTVLARVIAWAREHVEQRELEPIRSRIRNVISNDAMNRISATPSRLRGTYRVEMRSGDTSATWLFRTVDRPAYRWGEMESTQSIAEIIDAPFGSGYRLVGYAADSAGIVPVEPPRTAPFGPTRLVWLAAADRPKAPGNDSARALTAMLEFQRRGAPPTIWNALDPFLRVHSAMDSLALARWPVPRTRADDQAQLYLTLRIGRDGSVSADTSYVRSGRRLRVTLIRIDTVALTRPF